MRQVPRDRRFKRAAHGAGYVASRPSLLRVHVSQILPFALNAPSRTGVLASNGSTSSLERVQRTRLGHSILQRAREASFLAGSKPRRPLSARVDIEFKGEINVTGPTQWKTI
jgi:hypothetical protein